MAAGEIERADAFEVAKDAFLAELIASRPCRSAINSSL